MNRLEKPGRTPGSEQGFGHAVIAWNRSREAARAVAEALPYLAKARAVTVVMVDQSAGPDLLVKQGNELVDYLGRHSISLRLHGFGLTRR